MIAEVLWEWLQLRPEELRFGRMEAAILVATGLSMAAALLIAWHARRQQQRRKPHAIALAALLPVVRPSAGAAMRHAPFVLFVAGLGFALLALADPFTTLVREDKTFPGRRIAVLIDASSSMNQPFHSPSFNKQGGPTYFATVAAAEYFMRLRMEGTFRDLIALVEFGNEAYVVTPFTTDYENVLLSMRLIAEPAEWERFPDQGTIIMRAIQKSTELFETFDFLGAAGNLIVIFSDGQDSQTILQGRPIKHIMADARAHGIPVYMIRVAFNKGLGAVMPDELWKEAVEQTGGRFYPAADEATILRAVHEIDQLAPGKVELREYRSRELQFPGYALIAVLLWLAATAAKLGLRTFRTFP
ncbi:MAG TPA: vWA domain-containing protein [Steroidobacteraceae bacterium]